jgi:hypothetical protein
MLVGEDKIRQYIDVDLVIASLTLRISKCYLNKLNYCKPHGTKYFATYDDDVNSNKVILLIKEECLDLDDDDVVIMSFALVVLVLMWVRCFWYQC